VRLSVAVQHHPSRADLLPPLLRSLEPLDVEVVVDPDPDGPVDAWRSYRPCLERTPDGCYRVILQDDVRVCNDFAATLERVVAAQPDALIVLCVCGLALLSSRDVRNAHWRGASWARLVHRQWVPVLATVWPPGLPQRALPWVDLQGWPRMFRADDEVVGRIADGLCLDVLATVPSIVQHDDMVESLCRQADYGRNPARVAALFYEDVSNIDWTLEPYVQF
jgi:hypothetical protein